MKISKFQFEDKSLEWRLEELSLNKLTLLVGASGVGKTQILRALMRLKEISDGKSINGVVWNIEFETLSKQKYVWQGEFEDNKISNFLSRNEEPKNKSNIRFEKLFLDNNLIVDRTSDKILFNGQPTIKLSQQESILSLLKEEELIKNAYNSFEKLYFAEYLNNVKDFVYDFENDISSFMKQYDTLKKIQESNLDIIWKLFLSYKNGNKIFDTIKQRFIDIFPQVENIEISLSVKKNPAYIFVEIKEKEVKKWIPQRKISSGMFRTLMQLSELYLCAEGTVFLIDEFENSLGINCISEITSDILASRRQLQFILTSHHPYIIDTIGFEHWKLVTRNAGTIKTHNIDKFGIGKSKHSAFMQLLQLEEYQTGQEQL